ncbi:hypothetical protein T484DRAFT_1623421, partial [Baffinella frigidus]
KPGTRNPEPGTRNPKPGTRDPEPGTRNPGPGTRDPELGTRNPEPGTRNLEHSCGCCCARVVHVNPAPCTLSRGGCGVVFRGWNLSHWLALEPFSLFHRRNHRRNRYDIGNFTYES